MQGPAATAQHWFTWEAIKVTQLLPAQAGDPSAAAAPATIRWTAAGPDLA